MCVTAWLVGDLRFSGDLKVRQYVCSGVREDGRAVNLTWAIGWTSAAMLGTGCGTGAIETWLVKSYLVQVLLLDHRLKIKNWGPTLMLVRAQAVLSAELFRS
jgi:hypothetical protein